VAVLVVGHVHGILLAPDALVVVAFALVLVLLCVRKAVKIALRLLWVVGGLRRGGQVRRQTMLLLDVLLLLVALHLVVYLLP